MFREYMFLGIVYIGIAVLGIIIFKISFSNKVSKDKNPEIEREENEGNQPETPMLTKMHFVNKDSDDSPFSGGPFK